MIGALVVATNKEILEQIDELRKKIPNGELTLLAKSIEDLQIGQKELKDDIRDLKKQLLDPDDGVVVRVNNSNPVLMTLPIGVLSKKSCFGLNSFSFILFWEPYMFNKCFYS